ncbi:hypothetical protein RRSWK_00568 [Rhodopirellula sp. SWK7]|nr:hypothetical protein RRSWK_00568 [Rhodopirellula sp. SWK7]
MQPERINGPYPNEDVSMLRDDRPSDGQSGDAPEFGCIPKTTVHANPRHPLARRRRVAQAHPTHC